MKSSVRFLTTLPLTAAGVLAQAQTNTSGGKPTQ